MPRLHGSLVRPVAVSLLAFVAPPAAAQTVWVVDALNLPGAHFTDIQPAVDAAADGDVVLVRGRLGAVYGPVAVAGRSLVIAGEPDGLVPAPVVSLPVTGPIRVEDLGPGQTVVLRGLVAHSFAPSFVSSLLVHDCAGQVFVEDAVLDRGDGPSVPAAVAPALTVSQSPAVTLVRTVVAGESAHLGGVPGDGASFINASAFLYHVQVAGGRGAPVESDAQGQLTPATDGAFGATIGGSAVHASGSVIRGGDGGLGFVDPAQSCLASADGGAGVWIAAGALNPASLTRLGTGVDGGAGGVAPGATCPAGADGDDFVNTGSDVVQVPTTARGFCASSPVREGESVVLTFDGTPGDLAVLALGELGGPVQDPAFDGPLHVASPASLRFVGVVPTGGQFRKTATVNELGAGIEAVSLALQAVYLEPLSQRFTGGDPSAVLLLDSAF